MYNFFLCQSCSSFQTNLTNALHPRQQLFLSLQQLFQALDGVFQAARCTATALPVLHVLQAEEAVAAVELPLPTPPFPPLPPPLPSLPPFSGKVPQFCKLPPLSVLFLISLFPTKSAALRSPRALNIQFIHDTASERFVRRSH